MSQEVSLLKVSGPDAKKLLQGQLTCNVEEVSPENSLLGAHCNREGRILSLFRLFLRDDSYYMEMPAPSIPQALAALKKYAVFYKVQLEETSHAEVGFSAPALNKLSQISAGIPAIYPATQGLFLPHEINLQRLNAISFNKGCYTGQEIIARMHYRGQLKKQMYLARVKTRTAPLLGADIYGDGAMGTIVDSCEEQVGSHQVLVVTTIQAKENQQLFLDPAKIELLEFVPLPY